MKRTILFLLLFFTIAAVMAQNGKTGINKFYGGFGGGPTTYNGGVGIIALRTVLSNNWTFGLSYHGIGMDPNNQPADFEPDIAIFFPIYPSVDMDIFSVTAGKVFPASKRVWFTTEAGLSLVSGNEYQYILRQRTGGLGDVFLSNYSYTEERKTSAGVMLKAEVNWAFLNFAGLGADVFTSINGIQSPVGASFKLIIGKMNIRKRRS